MQTSTKTKAAIGVLGALTAVGVAAWIYQLMGGLGVTGMNNGTSWGLYITMFMFFVGLSAGGLIVASSASVFHVADYKKVALPAVILSTVCICCAGMFVLIDLGGIQRVWRIVTGPNPTSPLFWDICVITLYLVINIVYLRFMTSKKPGAQDKVAIVSRFALPVAILFISATNPSEFAASLVEGFKAMVPAILILTLAWTLSGVCGEDYLNAGGFVSQVVNGNQMAHTLMPGIFFLIALGLAFATGTSWGTFGILIPITIAIFGDMGGQVMVLTVAAVLAGAVCGDHISPISDTTILASTGANCNHIEHVSTQMPYALLVAACCLIGYLVAGFTSNGWLGLGVGFVLLMAALIVLLARFKKQKGAEASQAAGK